METHSSYFLQELASCRRGHCSSVQLSLRTPLDLSESPAERYRTLAPGEFCRLSVDNSILAPADPLYRAQRNQSDTYGSCVTIQHRAACVEQKPVSYIASRVQSKVKPSRRDSFISLKQGVVCMPAVMTHAHHKQSDGHKSRLN